MELRFAKWSVSKIVTGDKGRGVTDVALSIEWQAGRKQELGRSKRGEHGGGSWSEQQSVGIDFRMNRQRAQTCGRSRKGFLSDAVLYID